MFPEGSKVEVVSKSYMKQKLTYTDDGRLLDPFGRAVMMDWEEPIMKHQAHTVASNGGDVLNVGFGLGLVDGFIQSYSPKTHWIIEGHPDVQRKMIEDGWLKKPNVRCIFSKWQDVIHHLPKFDGIYWDTWDEEPYEFFEALPKLLKNQSSIFSFFNKPYPKDLEAGSFMHLPYKHALDPIVDISYTSFKIPKISSPEEQGRMYWLEEMSTYYDPICKLKFGISN